MTRMRSLLLTVLLLAVLTACGGDPGAVRGEVSVTMPLASTVHYASALSVRGTASGAPALKVVLADADGGVLSEARLQPDSSGAFAAEVVHGYSGEPLEAVLSVLAADDAAAEPYAVIPVTLAASAHRPDGVYAYITTPMDGGQVGGDLIQVAGRASGLADTPVTVTLTDEAGQVIATQEAAPGSPYALDEVPWSVAFERGDYTGNAVIRMTYGDVSESLAVQVTEAAG